MNYFLGDTKENIYWQEFLEPYKPKSGIGLEIWKTMKPFTAAEEDKWNSEIESIAVWESIIKKNSSLLSEIEALYQSFHDIRNLLGLVTQKRITNPLIDGFYLKQFLWFSYSLSRLIINTLNNKERIANLKVYEFIQLDWEKWLLLFQPNYNGIFYPNFALQDIDNSRLKLLREEKRKRTIEVRKLEQERRKIIEEKYKLKVNLEGYLIINRDNEKVRQLFQDPQLKFIRSQGENLVYFLSHSTEEQFIQTELQRLNRIIEGEETRAFNELLEIIEEQIPIWLEAIYEWGKLEVVLKKTKMAIDINGTKPILAKQNEPAFFVQSAYHPYLAELWKNNKRDIKGFTIKMEKGVTVIYGANMSGKTIILRTVGLIQALAQHGFYVPARELYFSFVSYLTLVTGDYQNVEQGLSSFGAEVSRLGQDLIIKKNVLYLFDEIGKGTNPIEGEALAIAVLRYLRDKQGAISLLVSHFPNLIQEEGISLYETKNYQLYSVDKASMVFEGIKISEKLGLPSSIVNEARRYLGNLE